MTRAGMAAVERTKSVPAYSVHLDTVRGLAALAVFIGHGTYMFLGASIYNQTQAHLGRATAAVNSHSLVAQTHMGHQAVIIFFVLSGFFVGGGAVRALRLGRWSWKSYLLNRFTRLWMVLIPALFLGLVLDSIGVRFFGTAPEYARLFAPIVSVDTVGHLGAGTFIGNLFFLQRILVPVFGSNGPLWSLSFEFWYYIMFPLLMIGVAVSNRVVYRVCLLAAAIGLAVFCGREISLYYLMWLMGVAAFLLPITLPPTLAKVVTPLACLVFGGFNIYVVARPYNLVLSDFTTAVIFTAILWLILHYREPAKESLYRSAATRLSAMSYTLYTVHFTIMALIRAWMAPVLSHRSMSLRSVGILLAVYAFTFSVAYLFYRCFEANTATLRKYLEKRLKFA